MTMGQVKEKLDNIERMLVKLTDSMTTTNTSVTNMQATVQGIKSTVDTMKIALPGTGARFV